MKRCMYCTELFTDFVWKDGERIACYPCEAWHSKEHLLEELAHNLQIEALLKKAAAFVLKTKRKTKRRGKYKLKVDYRIIDVDVGPKRSSHVTRFEFSPAVDGILRKK